MHCKGVTFVIINACNCNNSVFIKTIVILRLLVISYGTKILHGIKIYGFKVAGRALKLKFVNFYYHVTKIPSCFDLKSVNFLRQTVKFITV